MNAKTTCPATCTTAYGARLTCWERNAHGGAHYAEDREGRTFLWSDEDAAEYSTTEWCPSCKKRGVCKSIPASHKVICNCGARFDPARWPEPKAD